MPGTRIIKTGLADLYDARIYKAWIQGYGEPEHEFEQFLRTQDTEVEDYRWSHISGFGLWPRKTLGANVSADTVYQGYDTTCTPATYARMFTVEEETVEDDRHSLLGEQLSSALAQAGRDTLETLAASMFNNADTTTYASPWVGTSANGDGLALLSTAHTILSGGTYANTASAAVDLSVASLQAARTRLEKCQDARGRLWSLDATTLIVPSDSRWLMSEILDSPKMPYTADNTPNVVREGLTGKVWKRLTDTDSWFLLAGKAGDAGQKGHMLTFLSRLAAQFKRHNEFLSGDRQYRGRLRFGFCAPDFRGIDGSMGG